MGRTLLYSIAGAGAGFLIGYVAVSVAAGPEERDTRGVILFVGSFLAGTGAIAGAVIGGVAELREFFRRKDQAPGEAQVRDK